MSRGVGRINTGLSNWFYNYGKFCGSRFLPLFIFSFTLICFLSLPAIFHFLQNIYANSLTLPYNLSSMDGQFWLYSPHIHRDLIFKNKQPTDILVKQIRIYNIHKQVDNELLLYAHDLQQRLLTTSIKWQSYFTDFDSICFHDPHNNKCIIHSPTIYWENKKDLINDLEWEKTVNHYMQLSSSHISSQKNISYFKYVQLPTHFAAGPSIQPLSLFGNVTYDVYGNFVSADSIIITMFLQPKQHFSKDDIDFIWNSLWDDVATRSNINIIKDISDNIDSPSSVTSWSLRIKSKNQTWYYKYKLIPVGLSLELALSILVYFLMFYLISTAFAKSTQVKSHYLFGFASLFSAVATCTTTLGLLQLFGIELKLMPWYLYPLICGVASLENIFLLTQAVLYSGCDMRVTEKIARGLQSVGVPMTLMLIAEIMILYIGSAIDSELVQEFCFFTKFALIVEYIMVYTFFIAFLSIDVKRLELTDLNDRQMSKRLHELANRDKDVQQDPNFCPIHDDVNDDAEPKTCADCKEFKTHRTINAVLLCLLILGLSLFRKSYYSNQYDHSISANLQPDKINVMEAANRFWNTVNPKQNTYKISVLSPHLVVQTNSAFGETHTDPTISSVLDFIYNIEKHYTKMDDIYSKNDGDYSFETNAQSKRTPSLFRSFIYRIIKFIVSIILSVNVPLLLLCIALVLVCLWFIPQLRRKWVIPVAHNIGVWIKLLDSFLFNQRIDSLSTDYDANGVHLGAISAQEQFNEKNKSSVKGVEVKTLSGKHVADLRRLTGNGKQGTVLSCDHDGRIVLWDTTKSTWMARLDRLEATTSNGGALLGDLNPQYYRQPKKIKRWQRAFGAYQQEQHRRHSSNVISSCVKIDQGNRWAVAAYDNGVIRVWNITSGTLACELNARLDSSRPMTPEQDNNVTIYDTKHQLYQHQQKQQQKQQDNIYTLRQRNHSSISNKYNNNIHISNQHYNNNNNNNNNLSASIYPLHNNHIINNNNNQLNNSSTSAISLSTSTSASTSSSTSSSILRHSHFNDIPLFNIRDKNNNGKVDKILAVHFIGAVAEYCHPLVAELAAQQHTAAGQSVDPNTSQNFLISVHKSGYIREWDLFSGECIQSFSLGHKKDITYLHAVECKAPHRKLGVTWVFTASKDGWVKCWERRLTSIPVSLNGKESSDANNNSNNNNNNTNANNNSNNNPNSKTTSSWTCLYSIQAHEGKYITSIATAIPVGGMGLLVTGSNNGSVKVWNFETGELVNTLSHGASSIIEDSDYEQTRFSDHTENIVQLVVTRYCDVDTGPGLCRGCDTCFGNGFFISSSDTDGTVHVWRLERSGGDIDHNCNLCTKDYHRQKYGRSSRTATGSVGAGDDNSSIKSNGRRRHQRKHSYSSTSSTTSSTTNISSSTTRRIRRYKPNVRPPPSSATMDDWVNGLLDIEQLAGNDDIDLDCVFLGKIHHVESRSLVFCDNMILAGVRKKQQQQHEQQQRSSIKKNSSTECEAWFASLQYFEPQKNIEDHDIPIEVFDLESVSTLHQSILNDTNNLKTDQSGSLWKCFSWLFRSKFTPSPKIKINGKDIDNNNKLLLVEEDEDMDDDNDDDYDSLEDSNGDDYVKDPMNIDSEALEMLPFSSIEHAVSLEGLGFACDYGNFIKVICLDNVKSDALRHQQYLSTSMNGQIYDSYSLCSWPNDKINSGDNINNHGNNNNNINNNNNNDTNQSIKSTNSQCQCKSNGKECCGGKPKNGEKCCGSKSASSRSTTYSLSTPNITSTAAIANNSNSNNTAIACNPRSITECMSKSNCSRAGDCPLATSNTKSRWF